MNVFNLSAILLSAALVFTLGSGDGRAADLSTTNEHRIEHFWSAVQRGDGPVTVLSFGDSVSDHYRSIQVSLFARMQEHFGSRGVAFTGWSYKEIGGGAERVAWGPDWWADHTRVPPGGFVTWLPQQCDDVGVFWVARPGGGLFQLSAVEGSTIIPLLTLNGQAPAASGCYTNVHINLGTRGLRADGISGTNMIVAARLVNTSASGICTGFLAKDGQNLGAIFNLSTNILYPILSAINPQLVVWHMKDLGDIGETILSNRLYDLEAMWKASVTNGDVVYIGTPYDFHDVGSEFSAVQNRLVRQAAVRDTRAYIDCMTPCISYETMVQYKLLDDTVHPSPLGNSFMAHTIVWPQLGLGRLAKGAPLQKWPLPKPPLWMTNSAEVLGVYGWAVWTPEEGTVVLRNPATTTKSFLLDAQAAFSLSPSAPKLFDMRRCDRWSRVPVATLQAGNAALVTLNASETVALEADPRTTLLSMETYGANLVVRWPVGQSLEEANSANGTWSAVTGAVSPWITSPTSAMHFYRTVTNSN